MNARKVSEIFLKVYAVVLPVLSIALFCSTAGTAFEFTYDAHESLSGPSSQFVWSAISLIPVVGVSLTIVLAIDFHLEKSYKLAFLALFLPLINFTIMGGAILQEPALLKLKLSLDPAEVYYNRGWDLANHGNHIQAIANFTYSIQLDPNNSYVYEARGNSYLATGNSERALVDYNKVVELDPKNDSIYRVRGDIYYELGKYEQAEADYTQAIELNDRKTSSAARKELSKTYVKRGVINDILGKSEQAILDFKKAIELSSDPWLGYNEVAWILAHDLDTHYEQALEYALRSVQLSSQAANHDTLGLVYYKLEQYEKAVEHYTIALLLEPEQSESYKQRGDAYLALGNKQAALADYQTYLAKEPNGAEREDIWSHWVNEFQR